MRFVRAVVWSALVLVGSLAAAGLVLALDHPPTDAARPELTARDAAVLAPRLAAIEPSLRGIADAAQGLSDAGRGALVNLRALDVAATTEAIDAGDVALGSLTVAAAEARTLGPGLLAGLGDGSRLPAAQQERVAAIDEALRGVDGLTDAWATIADATAAPLRVIAGLRAHDAAVVRAAELGRAERYGPALDSLDAAAETLAEVATVRDAAAGAGRDVTMLDGWIVRLVDYDAALRGLYEALQASGGGVTAEVDAARARVAAARDALPETQDALVIAVTDLGAGDITPSLLAIEEVRGVLESALAPPEGSTSAVAIPGDPSRVAAWPDARG